jgi:hypothetical protein
MYSLGVSNGKMGLEIRIYMKNGMGKCDAWRKSVTVMAGKRETNVADDDQWQ